MLAIPIGSFTRYNPKLPRRSIDAKELSICDNTEIRDGQVYKSSGWSELTAINLEAPARHIREHIVNDGTRYICILTATRFWVYNASTNTIVNYTPGAGYTSTNQWSSCSYGNYFIFTNGVDKVQYWDGSLTNNAADLNEVSDKGTGAIRPLLVLTFGSHLLMLNDRAYVDKTDRKIYHWSKPGTVTEFRAAQGAGSAYLYEGTGEIRAACTLSRDTIAVYKTDSIHLIEYVGGTTYFANRSSITGIGVDSMHSMVQVGNTQIVLTNQGLRQYDGSTISPFAPEIDPILRQYFPNSNRQYTQLIYDGYNEQLWIFLPNDGSVLYASTALVYSYKESSWSRQTGFTTYAVCSALIPSTTAPRWVDFGAGERYGGSDGLTWQEAGATGMFWGGQTVGAQFRILVGDTTDTIYRENSTIFTRHGSSFVGTAETVMINPGFVLYQHPLINTEIVQIDLGITAGNPNVYIGISDRGDETITWNGPYTANSDGRIYKTLVGRWFIFRLTSSNAFAISGMTTWFVRRGVV